MSKTVLITGATGFIGGNLVKACVAKGLKVRAFVLPNDPEEEHVKVLGATVHHGDISDADAVSAAVQGVDIIFHCAGLVTDWAPKELFRKVLLQGTTNICQAAVDANVERLVHISTNDVFGMIEGQELNEAMPLKPWGEPYPDFKIQAEQTVWNYHKEQGLKATMVYPCWVYGLGDKTFVPLLADAIIKKEMLFWRKDVLVWPTYIDNLVELLLLISEKEEAIGNGFLVHDGESVTLQDFSAEIAKTMGVKPPELRIPYGVAYAAGLLMEFIWGTFRLKSRPLLTTYAVKNLGSRFRYSIKKAENVLGWTPRVGYPEGMARTMEWLRTLDLDELKQK